MNLDNVVVVGRVPWEPSDHAADLVVWHANDVPTAGAFETCGSTVVFTAIGDVDGRTSVWAYAPVTQDEAASLAQRSYQSVPEMLETIESLFDGRHVVLANARDFEISGWTVLPTPDGLFAAAVSHLQMVVATLNTELDQRGSRAKRGADAMPASPSRPTDVPVGDRRRLKGRVYSDRKEVGKLEAALVG